MSRRLKRILLAFGVVLLVFALVGLLLPSKVHVERSMQIAVAPERAFQLVNTLTNWEQWSPWHRLDPNMKIQYSGPPSGEGAKYSWQSADRNVGNGSLTITRSVINQSIDTSMLFDDGTATGSFRFEPQHGTTKVTWSMDSEMGANPVMRYLGLMMDRMVGPAFETGLRNIKSLAEGAPDSTAPRPE